MYVCKYLKTLNSEVMKNTILRKRFLLINDILICIKKKKGNWYLHIFNF